MSGHSKNRQGHMCELRRALADDYGRPWGEGHKDEARWLLRPRARWRWAARALAKQRELTFADVFLWTIYGTCPEPYGLGREADHG